MYASRPVVAVASGGPLESVIDGETGFLCRGEPSAFATALLGLARDAPRAATLGANGRRHVISNFTLTAFGDRLAKIAGALRPKRSVTAALVAAVLASAWLLSVVASLLWRTRGA
jgi:glycosyltransferase involved in cell wall biosynthesis